MPKMTLQVRLVLAMFLKDPDAELYGRRLCVMTGLPPGTIFPILNRLEAAGWLTSRWEKPSERTLSGSLRHYYSLTSNGWAVARQEARGESLV